MLSSSKFDLHLSSCSKSKIGYRVRLRLNIRGSEDFLLAVNRSLLQYEVGSQYKAEEHKSRPRPILQIGGIINLYKLSLLIPATTIQPLSLVGCRQLLFLVVKATT